MQAPSKEWILKMAKLEDGCSISAGNPDFLRKIGIAELLRSQVKQAMKDRNEFERDLLRLTLSEVEAVQSKLPKNADFDKLETCGLNAIRKMIGSNTETIGFTKDETAKAKLQKENDYLSLFLPKNLDQAQIREILLPLTETLRGLDSNKAMGPAMKALKPHGSVDSTMVKAVIEEIKNS